MPDRAVDGPHPIALVHGFTQTSASWDRFVPALRDRIGDTRRVVAVDAPGHGSRGDVHLDLVDGARLLADEVGRAVWIGYSMGGRLAIHLALERPEAVEAMVLIGATAGIDDPGERAARRRRDEALADEVERDGVDAFLDRWLTQPLFSGLTPSPGDLAARRANTAAGLASSLRLAGTGAQQPLWDRLAAITAPVLVLAGAHDDKFVSLGHRLTEALPAGTLALVPGAGHAAHLEAPAATAELIASWLPT